MKILLPGASLRRETLTMVHAGEGDLSAVGGCKSGVFWWG